MLTTAGVTFSATSAIAVAFQTGSAANAGVESAKKQGRTATERSMPYEETNERCTLFSLRSFRSVGRRIRDLRHRHFGFGDGDRDVLRDRAFARRRLGLFLKTTHARVKDELRLADRERVAVDQVQAAHDA